MLRPTAHAPAALLALTGVLAGCGAVVDGDGWRLVASSVDSDATPGTMSSFEHPDGTGVRLVAATSTGGDVDCEAPWIGSVIPTEQPRGIEVLPKWPQRGCDDRGGAVFDLVLTDIDPAGIVVSFLPSPEAECRAATVTADGVMSATETIPCPPRIVQ